MAQGKIIDRPIPLGAVIDESVLVKMGARCPDDLFRSIGAERVDDVNIIGDGFCRKQRRLYRLIRIESQNNDGNADCQLSFQCARLACWWFRCIPTSIDASRRKASQ